FGIDRSAAMLKRLRHGAARGARASARGAIGRAAATQARVVRGDIRALPFEAGTFKTVIAPYGVLQSLTQPADLATALGSISRVLSTGGTLGIDIVPDVPNWRESSNRVQLRGRAGAAQLTLIESVRQDRRRRLTTFEQCYVERRNGRTREHRFE